jgi:hypothetical protein
MAQQITGTPGSPSATTTIGGKQLPPPPPPFGGEIKENAPESKAWWAPRVVPPKKAPNILLIMTDDSGFGVPSTFGGVEGMILTPGGRFAGYGFYLLDSRPVFLWNMINLQRIKWEGPVLAPGKHTVEFDFKYEGLGVGTLPTTT